jgi:carbon monoxide dehydrogenase subunit G
VRLTNEFEIDAPLETVWAILTDVQLVTPCIPRARLLEMMDETAFRVAVAVRVGLLTIDYVVAVKIDELDEVARTARLRIVGEELLGVGVVSAIVWSRVRTSGERTRVSFEADANIGGIIALVGRPIIELVLRQKMREFAANVARLADEFALGLLDFP